MGDTQTMKHKTTWEKWIENIKGDMRNGTSGFIDLTDAESKGLQVMPQKEVLALSTFGPCPCQRSPASPGQQGTQMENKKE